MSETSNRLAVSSAYSAANYLPATLKTNKSGWLIEYYVENPQTQETTVFLLLKDHHPTHLQHL